MGIIKRQILTVPQDMIEGAEEMVGRMMHMDVSSLPAKFEKPYAKTKETAYKQFEMVAVFESYEIDKIESERICLKNGLVIESALMAEMFGKATELVFTVTTLNGYDEADAEEPNMLLKMFLDSWGTAFVECANVFVENHIAKELEADELYTTHSFSPGQNDIPLEMQDRIFDLLKPEDIGVTLSESYMMHPKKSISGIFGIQETKDENGLRPCDLCDKRETCPNVKQ